MSWTLKTLAEWCNATVLPQEENIVVSHVTFDSRKVREGSLFIALKGEKVDGHDYVASALNQGAVAALVEREVPVDIPQMLVPSCAKAFGAMAAGYRDAMALQVVGITGSVGKTSTKEMMFLLLNSTYSTAKTLENHNNDLGLPMTVLEMAEDTQVAVLEMGMNHFGEMSYLTSIAKPDIAVITNIGTVHIEHLGSREGILQAKLEILEGLKPQGTVIFNGDEPLLWGLKDSLPHKKYYYGIENPLCDVVAKDIRTLDDGMEFTVCGLGHEMQVFLPAQGQHMVSNALAAISVALLCQVEPKKICDALLHFENTGMRQKIMEEKGMRIIVDCYNASPESMEAALHVLGDQKCQGRKIAVLGDMLELGTRSMAEHYRIGRLAASKADFVFAYGTYSDRTVTGALTGGKEAQFCEHFASHQEMADHLKKVAKAGDVLLFKGSRGMRMENVLKLFLEEDQR